MSRDLVRSLRVAGFLALASACSAGSDAASWVGKVLPKNPPDGWGRALGMVVQLPGKAHAPSAQSAQDPRERQYAMEWWQRDESYMVLFTEQTYPAGPLPENRVIDAIIIQQPKGLSLLPLCKNQQSIVGRVIALVSIQNPTAEWFDDVRQAWLLDVAAGKIRPIPTAGVRCSNPVG